MRLVKVEEHSRVLCHRNQQVAKAPGEIGANDLALVDAHPRDGGRFGGSDGEMIGPEISQSFGKIRVRLQSVAGTGQYFVGSNLVECTQG